MKVTLKQAFNLLDGRLSTEIGDVYEMLNYIFNTSFMTHELPPAMRRLEEINPDWYSEGKELINDIKAENNTDDFHLLMSIIDSEYPDLFIELQQIK